MRKPLSFLLVVIGSAFLAWIGAGCAGQEASRRTARILVGQTAKLQTDLEKAAKAEAVGYKDAASILGRAVVRESSLKEVEAIERIKQDFARQVLNSKNALTAAEIRDFLEANTRQVWESRKEVLAKGRADTEALSDGLKQLNAHADALDGVKKGLEQLQTAPDDVTRGQELFEWTKKVLDSVKQPAKN